MLLIVAFLAGAASVAAVAYPVWRQLRADLAVAHDRLYTAWREGAVIPPAPEPPAPPPAPIPDELRPYIDEWSNPTVRAQVEDRIRRMLARKLTPGEIGKLLLTEAQTPSIRLPV